MQTHSFKTQKTARYCTLGSLTAQTQQIWIACHGYGQLAPYFAKSFEGLDPEKHFVIIPEALSRFYLQGFSGRIGATWMTKEARLDDIEDYVLYLNQLYQSILVPSVSQHIKINIVGFSQGAATVCRWAANNKINFDRLILWAGVFPPDLPFEVTKEVFKDKKINLVYGLQDEFITNDILKEQKRLLESNNLDYEVNTFEGKHVIDPMMLHQLAEAIV